MANEAGLRERKRRQTRQALVGAAMRLFGEKGYDETTVAQIAAAAGVSTKTFFNYFASKDEVLFPHLAGRIDRAVSVIEHRGPGEDLADVLIRAMEQMLADAVRDEPAAGLASARLPLLMSVPAVQAATLRRYFLAETRLAEALHRAYPDILDPEAAAAVIGSLMGAVLAAALASMEHGGTTDQVQAAARRAMGIAVGGLRPGGRGAPPSPASPERPADGLACLPGKGNDADSPDHYRRAGCQAGRYGTNSTGPAEGSRGGTSP